MTFGTGEDQEGKDLPIGLLLTKRRFWNEALAAYRQSLRIEPGRTLTHFDISRIYHDLGYDQGARRAFESASRLPAGPCAR